MNPINQQPPDDDDWPVDRQGRHDNKSRQPTGRGENQPPPVQQPAAGHDKTRPYQPALQPLRRTDSATVPGDSGERDPWNGMYPLPQARGYGLGGPVIGQGAQSSQHGFFAHIGNAMVGYQQQYHRHLATPPMPGQEIRQIQQFGRQQHHYVQNAVHGGNSMQQGVLAHGPPIHQDGAWMAQRPHLARLQQQQQQPTVAYGMRYQQFQQPEQAPMGNYASTVLPEQFTIRTPEEIEQSIQNILLQRIDFKRKVYPHFVPSAEWEREQEYLIREDIQRHSRQQETQTVLYNQRYGINANMQVIEANMIAARQIESINRGYVPPQDVGSILAAASAAATFPMNGDFAAMSSTPASSTPRQGRKTERESPQPDPRIDRLGTVQKGDMDGERPQVNGNNILGASFGSGDDGSMSTMGDGSVFDDIRCGHLFDGSINTSRHDDTNTTHTIPSIAASTNGLQPRTAGGLSIGQNTTPTDASTSSCGVTTDQPQSVGSDDHGSPPSSGETTDTILRPPRLTDIDIGKTMPVPFQNNNAEAGGFMGPPQPKMKLAVDKLIALS